MSDELSVAESYVDVPDDTRAYSRRDMKIVGDVITRLTEERDAARSVAVTLEQEVAELRRVIGEEIQRHQGSYMSLDYCGECSGASLLPIECAVVIRLQAALLAPTDTKEDGTTVAAAHELPTDGSIPGLTVVLRPDPLDGGWTADVVEMAGIVTEGATVRAALQNAGDAISAVWRNHKTAFAESPTDTPGDTE